MSWARDDGCVEAFVDSCVANEAAQRFYERQGSAGDFDGGRERRRRFDLRLVERLPLRPERALVSTNMRKRERPALRSIFELASSSAAMALSVLVRRRDLSLTRASMLATLILRWVESGLRVCASRPVAMSRSTCWRVGRAGVRWALGTAYTELVPRSTQTRQWCG